MTHQINEACRIAAFKHAQKVFPREACGLVVLDNGEDVYHPCKNKAVGTDHFILDPEDYAAAAARGAILAVVHSHPNANPKPSQADLVACEQTGITWHIVGCPTNLWATVHPSGYRAPLIGREWAHGVLDCLALIRDWYLEKRGIHLPDFERQDEWWLKGGDLYTENFPKAGFRIVTDGSLEVGDVPLMQILSDVPNHGAIYLGNDTMLHHLQNQLSCREVYGGVWRRQTRHVLRYSGEENAA